MSVDPASAPTNTGMSYLCPRLSITFSNKNALRWFSGSPRNCKRTSGCSSVSLLIGVVTRTSLPALSRPSTYLPSVGQYEAIKFSWRVDARTYRRTIHGFGRVLNLSPFVGDRLHLGDDRRWGRHNLANNLRHLGAGLRVEVEVQARCILAEFCSVDHFGEGTAVEVERLRRHSGRPGIRALDRCRR